MAIQYVGGTGAGRAGSTSSVNVAINSGLTGGIGSAAIAGDLVVVTVAVATQGRNPTCAVSGYTALTQQHTTATTYDISVCTSYKFMPTTPDTQVTIPSTGDIADGQGYEIHVFRGVDPTVPLDGVTPTYATGSGTNNRPDPQSITPATAGAWIYFGGGGAASTGTTVFTATYLSGFLSHNGADTNDGTAGAGYYSGWSSGPYDGAVWAGGNVNAANSWGCTTLALRPAASGGTAHTVVCADTIALDDGGNRSAAFHVFAFDGIAATDDNGNRANFLVMGSESITLNDLSRTVGIFLRSAADVVAFAETADRLASFSRTAEDRVVFGEAAGSFAGFLAAASDGIILGDETFYAILAAIEVFATDGIILSDETRASMSFQVTASDEILLGDGSSRIFTVTVVSSDGIILADSVSLQVTIDAKAADSIGFHDAASALAAYLVAAIDGVVLQDISIRFGGGKLATGRVTITFTTKKSTVTFIARGLRRQGGG